MKPWMLNLREIEPYTPGEQPRSLNVTKLNTNENPYPPAPGVRKVLAEITDEQLRRYPDPSCTVLTDALADYHGVGRDQVFAGVGSDDVLAVAFQTFFCSGKPLLFPDISYAFYEVWAKLFRIPYTRLPLTEDFRLRAEDYRVENGGIIFPNPNAPTSVLESLDFIEDIVKHNPSSVVVVDEAYIDFGGSSAIPLIDRYDNLVVVQTYSKSRSMAGMRIGYAIGSPEAVAAMNAVKFSYNSYTMNATALAAGVEALKDEGYFRECIGKICRTRDEAVTRLAGLGFSSTGAAANFLYVSNPALDAGRLFSDLRKADIFVRYFDKPRLSDKLRITIGTPEQMEVLYGFLEGYRQS
jgi:histidinol-phosphate aminotransferase